MEKHELSVRIYQSNQQRLVIDSKIVFTGAMAMPGKIKTVL
jgi:hypothetical protein